MVDEAADENSISDLKRHSEPSQRLTLGIQWASRVAQLPRLGSGWCHLQAGAQLYIRHCCSVFRTCSTGRTAAIAFMGARWGASHEAWSRQTPGSCSSPSKVVTFPPSGNSPPLYSVRACPCHLGPLEPLQPHFCRAETGKNWAAQVHLAWLAEKLLPNPWQGRWLPVT